MTSQPLPALFFDLSLTLGQPVLGCDNVTLDTLEIYADTKKLLESLKGKVRVGVLAFWDDLSHANLLDVLARIGVLDHLDRKLVFTGVKLTKTYFEFIANQAEVAPSQCRFVSQDSSRQEVAIKAGFGDVSFPDHVPAMLTGDPRTYVEVTGAQGHAPSQLNLKWQSVSGFDLLHDSPTAAAVPSVIGYATRTAMAALEKQGLKVKELMPPEDAVGTDLFLIRDGLDDEAFVKCVTSQLCFTKMTTEGLVVGIPPHRDIDEFHPPLAGHGHTIRLAPYSSNTQCDQFSYALPVSSLSEDDKKVLERLTAARVTEYRLPLVGEAPLNLPNNPKIRSRATQHPDNSLAVDHLCGRLKGIVGNSRKLPFPRKGMEVSNVEAEILGSALPNEVVILGAHLDSTARDTIGWTVLEGAAPGADDDASGVAAVLAAAEVLTELSQFNKPKRTIRFVLFNAEENIIAGSYAYVHSLIAAGRICVTAMIQMDMIGYVMCPELPERPYELHAPGPGNFNGVLASVIHRSVLIREAIADAGCEVSKGLTPQRYPIEGCDKDPTIHRSDQYQFLARQWPAVQISEDLFVDKCVDPKKAQYEHPGYHKITDTTVDDEYVSNIARAVAGAAWTIANGN